MDRKWTINALKTTKKNQFMLLFIISDLTKSISSVALMICVTLLLTKYLNDKDDDQDQDDNYPSAGALRKSTIISQLS